MSDEISLSMSLPLDSDGFLRRECPTCERELKFRVTHSEDAEEPLAGGYFCPYCGVQAPPEAWHTKPQIAYAQAIVARDGLGPLFNELEKSGFSVERNAPDP